MTDKNLLRVLQFIEVVSILAVGAVLVLLGYFVYQKLSYVPPVNFTVPASERITPLPPAEIEQHNFEATHPTKG